MKHDPEPSYTSLLGVRPNSAPPRMRAKRRTKVTCPHCGQSFQPPIMQENAMAAPQPGPLPVNQTLKGGTTPFVGGGRITG